MSNMDVDLYIIAAGKGSRMNTSIPKALVPIADQPCLTTTLQQIGHKFRKVFVATNDDTFVQEHWLKYFDDLKADYPELNSNVQHLPIRSGLGDGDAVQMALHWAAHFEKERVIAQDAVIIWGDVFFPQAEIIDELLSFPLNCAGIVPAVMEPEPYVQLETTPQEEVVNGAVLRPVSHALFSKNGETSYTQGYHDQSVFRFRMRSLVRALSGLRASTWKGNRYITPNNELSLLYTFHYLYNTVDPVKVYETKYPTLSFNTVEEVYNIQLEIDKKWKHKFRNQS